MQQNIVIEHLCFIISLTATLVNLETKKNNKENAYLKCKYQLVSV